MRSGRVLNYDKVVRRAAEAAVPDGDANRAGFLSDLGAGLRLLAETSGSAEDLAAAVQVHRAAAAAAATGDPFRPCYEYNIAASFVTGP